jgi:hypothetical protein
VLTLASAKERSTGPKADAPGPWRRHGGPGRRGREDDSVPPPGAARYSGSKVARTSWVQHCTTLRYGAGDVGATAPPARRRRCCARLQLLGDDAGLLGRGGQGDEDGGSIYRAALGFRANGWTAGKPWRLRLSHAAGIPRCRRSGAAAMGARRPAPRCASEDRR